MRPRLKIEVYYSKMLKEWRWLVYIRPHWFTFYTGWGSYTSSPGAPAGNGWASTPEMARDAGCEAMAKIRAWLNRPEEHQPSPMTFKERDCR